MKVKEEKKKMNTKQFTGIIKMIMALVEDNTPKEKLLEYLRKLIE